MCCSSPSLASRDLAVPTRVEGLKGVNVIILSGGWRHAVAADDHGRMFGWGWNKVSIACLPTCSVAHYQVGGTHDYAQLSC